MAPVVTGVSPKEGVPGTRVTVRGERLGGSQQDVLQVLLGEWDATMSLEWHSANKLVVLSGPVCGMCPVIITTRQGGVGTCMVQFRGVEPVVGPLKASAVWLDRYNSERAEILQELVSTHSMGQEDVLGISTEGYEARFPEEQLEEMFPGKTGNMFLESFEPCWFLLEHHQQSCYDDLRAGLSFLRRKVNSDQEGQVSFLKDNTNLVLEQLEALTRLHQLLISDRGDTDPMVTMQRALETGKLEADKLFAEVVRRKTRADRTRNTLALLQRYRLLFYFPVAIKRNAQRNDFDQIINDYSKVRGLYGESRVPMIQRVLRVIDDRVAELRDTLSTRLLDISDSYDEQLRLVRCLVSLGAPATVGWQCVVSECNSIECILRACREQYRSSASSATSRQQKSDVNSDTAAPPVVLFIEDIAYQMTAKLPALFRLANSYFRGDLHCQPDASKRADFRRMVRDKIELWTVLVRAALLAHTVPQASDLIWSDTVVGEPRWLSVCLREVHAVCVSAGALCSADGAALDELSQLMFDLRKYSLMAMFASAMKSVRQLPERDAWLLDTQLIDGLGHTHLLNAFNKRVVELAELVEESVLTKPVANETSLMQDETVRKDTVVLIYNLVATFAQFLEKLGFEETVSDDECDLTDEQQNLQMTSGEDSIGPLNIEKRLLLVLSNCYVLRSTKLPSIAKTFTDHGFPLDEVTSSMTKVADVLYDLDQKLFEAYIEEKSDPILGVIEMSMYENNYDWDNVTDSPEDVNAYVKELIVNCISVHAEVFSVSPLLLERVLESLTESIAEELARLFGAVPRMSVPGCQQAVADLFVVSKCLDLYTNQRAHTYFDATISALKQNFSDEASEFVDSVWCRVQSTMSLYLKCFSKKPGLEDFC